MPWLGWPYESPIQPGKWLKTAERDRTSIPPASLTAKENDQCRKLTRSLLAHCPPTEIGHESRK